MDATFILIVIFTTSLCLLASLFFRRDRQRLPPGPRPWPVVGNLLQLGTKPHQTTAALARVYGPLLYLKLGSRHVVVAASAAVAEQFLKFHDAIFSSRPPTTGGKYFAYNYKDLVFAPYGPRWRLLRKIFSVNLFSAKALENFADIRQEEVAILVVSVVSAGKTPVRLGQALNVCLTNTIARVTMGRRVVGHATGGGDEKAEEFKAMVLELMATNIFNIGDFVPALEHLDLQGVVAKLKKIHKRFDNFLSKILEEYKINGVGGKLSTFISFDDAEGGKLTDTDIKALLLNLFIAGTDTTSSTVEWAVAELLRQPEILDRVQGEIDALVGKDRLVAESDLDRLPYLLAVVKETFRLHPATPLSLPRIADRDCEVNGYFIPEGSTLLVNVWAISRDADQWTDPLEFRPDRFLQGGEKADVDVRGNNFEIIPFGAGRRICAGMSLGIRMVQLLTATLIHGFNFELAIGKPARGLNMEESFGLTLQRAEPLVVLSRPRLETRIYPTQY